MEKNKRPVEPDHLPIFSFDPRRNFRKKKKKKFDKRFSPLKKPYAFPFGVLPIFWINPPTALNNLGKFCCICGYLIIYQSYLRIAYLSRISTLHHKSASKQQSSTGRECFNLMGSAIVPFLEWCVRKREGLNQLVWVCVSCFVFLSDLEYTYDF